MFEQVDGHCPRGIRFFRTKILISGTSCFINATQNDLVKSLVNHLATSPWWMMHQISENSIFLPPAGPIWQAQWTIGFRDPSSSDPKMPSNSSISQYNKTRMGCFAVKIISSLDNNAGTSNASSEEAQKLLLSHCQHTRCDRKRSLLESKQTNQKPGRSWFWEGPPMSFALSTLKDVGLLGKIVLKTFCCWFCRSNYNFNFNSTVLFESDELQQLLFCHLQFCTSIKLYETVHRFNHCVSSIKF